MSGQHSQLETINSLYLGTSKASGQDMMSPVSAHDPPYTYFQNTSPPGHSHHLGLNASPHRFSPELLQQPPNPSDGAKLTYPPPFPDEHHNVLFVKAAGATPTQGSENSVCQGFAPLVCPENPMGPVWVDPHPVLTLTRKRRRRGNVQRLCREPSHYVGNCPWAHNWPSLVASRWGSL